MHLVLMSSLCNHYLNTEITTYDHKSSGASCAIWAVPVISTEDSTFILIEGLSFVHSQSQDQIKRRHYNIIILSPINNWKPESTQHTTASPQAIWNQAIHYACTGACSMMQSASRVELPYEQYGIICITSYSSLKTLYTLDQPH